MPRDWRSHQKIADVGEVGNENDKNTSNLTGVIQLQKHFKTIEKSANGISKDQNPWQHFMILFDFQKKKKH